MIPGSSKCKGSFFIGFDLGLSAKKYCEILLNFSIAVPLKPPVNLSVKCRTFYQFSTCLPISLVSYQLFRPTHKPLSDFNLCTYECLTKTVFFQLKRHFRKTFTLLNFEFFVKETIFLIDTF